MQIALTALAFGIIGLAILAINISFGTATWLRFFSHNSAPQLAPFEIVGRPQAEAATLQTAMPKMVLSRLVNIREQSEHAISALQAIRETPTQNYAQPADARYQVLEIPEQFARPIDIEWELENTTLGWVVKFLTEHSSKNDSIEVTVLFDNESPKDAHIYGRYWGKHGESFTLQSSGGIRDAVEQVALSIAQLTAKRFEPEFGELNSSQFVALLDATTRYSQLETDRERGHPRDTAYAQLLQHILDNAGHIPTWEALQLLIARISERAKNWEVAFRSYENLLAVVSEEDPRHIILRSKKAAIEERLSQEKRLVEVDEGDEEAKTVLTEEMRNEVRERVNEFIDNGRSDTGNLRKLMGIKETRSTHSVRVAVIGGGPLKEFTEDASVRFVNGEDSYFGSASDRKFQSEILQVMRLLAPDSEYIYAPISSSSSNFGGVSLEDLIDGMELLSGIDGRAPDIMLLIHGGNTVSKKIDDKIREISEQSVVVVAAGHKDTDREMSVYSNITDSAIVVGALDLMGRALPWSASGDGVVWAPGGDVPVISADTAGLVKRSGTAFSAALVAGAIANLLALYPDEKVAKIHQAIVQSAEKRGDRSGVLAVDFEGAETLLKN